LAFLGFGAASLVLAQPAAPAAADSSSGAGTLSAAGSALCHQDRVFFSCNGTAVVRGGGKTVIWKALACKNWNTFDLLSTPGTKGFFLSVPSRTGGRVRDGHYRVFLLSFTIGSKTYSSFTESSVTISRHGTRGSFRATAYLEQFSGSFRC
jgi:hypothetical protein